MPELNTPAHYRIAQSKFKCKVGDRVRVSHPCKDYENGWHNVWVPDMDSFIGRYGTVSAIDEIGGVYIAEICLWFPYFCLDIVG